jgi:hypothetical protein
MAMAGVSRSLYVSEIHALGKSTIIDAGLYLGTGKGW